ncbi:hypothetical protein [Nitrosopumilus adriaticus]|uniref:hypothetical protein n=1 Tax=Nitrosopumilus adriaticus TaxID=1580092 RepID=UPI00064FDF3D|nr:hypothetical protein [Nitrosopumilus adriaticus]
MKKRCIECKKRFNRIDVFAVEKSWLKKRHVCRTCLQEFLRKTNPSSDGGDLWICAHCRPLQKFLDKDAYITHHYFSHH